MALTSGPAHGALERPVAHSPGPVHRATAFTMRASVAGLRTAHSLTLITVHPSRRRARDTRRSRPCWFRSCCARIPCSCAASTCICNRARNSRPRIPPPCGQARRNRVCPRLASACGSPGAGRPEELRKRQLGGGIAARVDGAMILDRTSFGTWSIRHRFSFTASRIA